MSITPEQARELLDGATPSPWRFTECESIIPFRVDFWDDDEMGHKNADLAAAAPDLAETIAGMTEQWRHEAWHDRGDGVGPWRSLGWPYDDGWRNTRESADFDLEQADGTFKHRLVRRLVGPVEVVDGE